MLWVVANDVGSARQAEIDAMSKGDIFKSFYAQLEEIQKYHKKFPDLVERPVCFRLFR